MQPSPKEKKNPAEIVDSILTRFVISQGWQAEPNDARDERVASWLEVLGAARVSPSEYDRCYRRAMVTRTVRRAQELEISHWIRPEDLVVEWLIIYREAEASRENERAPRPCDFPHDDVEDRLVRYHRGPADTDGDLLPCHQCRPKAHAARKAARIYTATPAESRPAELPRYQPPLARGKVIPEGALSPVRYYRDALHKRIRTRQATAEDKEGYRVLCSIHDYLTEMGETL